MMRGLSILATFLCLFLFPWPVAFIGAVLFSLLEPLLPLAVGILAEALFYAPGQGLPFYALGGLLATLAAYFVQSRLKAGIIR